MKQMATRISSHPIIFPLIILIFGVLAYVNTFKVPFTLDDLTSITENPLIRDLANYSPGGPAYDFIPRRWFGYLTFALNYHFGGLNVTGYHAFNLAVHLFSALLVYFLVGLTFRTPHLAGSRLLVHSRTIAFIAALFFVAHPIQTQAVTYVVQRLTSLSTLFYLLAAVCYVAARLGIEALNGEPAGKRAAGKNRWQTIPLLAVATVAAVLAMQTKETAFTLPLALLLYEFSFFRGEWKRRALYLLPLLLTLPIIPLGVLATGDGRAIDPEIAGLGEQLRAQTDLPRLHYLFTQFRVIVTYLRLLILPIGQNLDHEYPVFTTFSAPPVFLSFLALIALFAVAVYLHLRSDPRQAPAFASELSRDPSIRLVAFGIFWFFLGLSVESTVVPIFDVIFEHRLYLPSIGLFAALATLVLLASEKSRSVCRGRIPLLATSVVIVILSAATFQRNQVWGSNITLWEDVARKSPGKARPWYNFGCYLTDAGRFEESIDALARAIRIDPQHADAWHNLGRAYILTGRIGEAVPALQTAVRLEPQLDNAKINLSVALIQNGQPAEAALLLERNLSRLGHIPEVRANLCAAYIAVGNLSAARNELALLYRVAPHLTPPLANLLDRASAEIVR